MFYKIFLFFLLLNSTILPEGFVTGTLVKTKTGYVPIETIKENDFVLTYNFKNKNIEEDKVKSVKINNYPSSVLMNFNDTNILVSPEHKFYCPMNKNRWTLARNIKTGDYILRNIQDLIKVNSVNNVESKNDFYCLSIENNHNYFITNNDILVHNFVIAIPIFTWIIGEGVVWAGLGTAAAVTSAVVINEVAKKNNIDCSGITEIGNVRVNLDRFEPNKIWHIINEKDHGFLNSCNLGGPDEDPDEWIKRIKETVNEANKNPNQYSSIKSTNISTKWKSSDPKFGELIVRVFKVKNVMRLSTAYLRDLRLKP